MTRAPVGHGSGPGRTSPPSLNHPDLARAFVAELPSHPIATCDVPGGRRTVVPRDDGPPRESMTRKEFCGRTVEVAGATIRV